VPGTVPPPLNPVNGSRAVRVDESWFLTIPGCPHLKAAKALGLSIPQSLRLRADQLIE